MREFDALVALNVDRMLDEVQPRTVFNCIAYGAYSFETDGELILRTNLMSTHALLERLTTRNIAAYIHAGSSSEYGENAAGPEEHDFLAVNSEYAVSKAACAHLIHYYGKQHGLPSANLRLYSVYGPLEDPSRLMPKIVQHGVRGELPPLVDPHIARDFVYSDDVVDAFVAAASELREDDYGDSFNVGTGRQTTIGELAEVARELYGIEQPATFTMPPRRWDVGDWYANSARAQKVLGWEARTPLEDGLERMTVVVSRASPNPERYRSATKEVALDAEHSITAVIACYRDARGDPGHVPAADRHVRGARRRLRDHLRQRREPRRQRAGDPRDQRARPARAGHLALAQLRLAGGVPQRHGARDEERGRAARRRPAGSARADRAVRRAAGRRATTSSTGGACRARRRGSCSAPTAPSTGPSTASRTSRSRATPATSR